MAQTFWTYSGDIAVDAQGRPILCDECPCPDNSCNSCVPSIPDTLYVTFSGLGGDLAVHNGKKELSWAMGCSWVWFDGARMKMLLEWDRYVSPDVWYIYCNEWSIADTTCIKEWTLSEPVCNPTGNYVEFVCADTDCSDPNTCNDSAGATCVVSLT